MRLPDVANMSGLILGALGIIFTGLELNKLYIVVTGIIALVPFTILFGIYLGMFILDFIKLKAKQNP